MDEPKWSKTESNPADFYLFIIACLTTVCVGIFTVFYTASQWKKIGLTCMKAVAKSAKEPEIKTQNTAFMLKRATEEPLGCAASIIDNVLENAVHDGVITATQKRTLLQEMALKLSLRQHIQY